MRLLKKKKILIIKFGGLGDFILSLSAIESIKKHHKKDDIILVTEKPYKEIALKSNYFKEKPRCLMGRLRRKWSGYC